MSRIVMCSQMQMTVGLLPGGKEELPPKDIGQQSPKSPPNEEQPLRRSWKRAQACQAKLSSKKPWPKANPSIPGELTFFQMLSNINMSSDRMTDILIDSLSPLSPQQTEQESSRVLKDPTSPLRTESPLMQVYTKGIMPLRDWPEGMKTLEERVILLNLQMVLATVTEFLDEIHHQWLHYRPEGPHGQPGNAGEQQATAINWMLKALDVHEISNYPSRASSPGEAPTIKGEGQPSQGIPKEKMTSLISHEKHLLVWK